MSTLEIVAFTVAGVVFFVVVTGGTWIVTWRFFQRTDITSRPLPDPPSLRPLVPFLWPGLCTFAALLWLMLAKSTDERVVPVVVLLMFGQVPMILRWWGRHRRRSSSGAPGPEAER